ncbi:MAG: hypothetical protein OWS74_01725 [Firmicutes bacterium]|nr:hypothetical protein [Bacillota bacterium]
MAQEVHFVIGVLFVIASAAANFTNHNLYYGAIAIIIIAILKESIFDPLVEKAPFFWDGAEDFLFYVIGVAIGIPFTLFVLH